MTNTTWRELIQIALIAAATAFVCLLVISNDTVIDVVERLTIHNSLIQGRDRLPYGESDQAYNLSPDSLTAAFATHRIDTISSDADEVTDIVLLGDSSVWGILLDNNQTISHVLENALDDQSGSGRFRVHNLGYPTLSAAKDMLILSYVLEHDIDAVIWFVTMDSFATDSLFNSPVLASNPRETSMLLSMMSTAGFIDENRYGTVPNDTTHLSGITKLYNTVSETRQHLSQWWRLQWYGVAWAMTDVDQITFDYEPLTFDFDGVNMWRSVDDADGLTSDVLDLRWLEAISTLTSQQDTLADIPIIVVNEPIFIVTGENSELNYNAWYPVWAYDEYRRQLKQVAQRENLSYIDMWDTVPATLFTDSPVHYNAQGVNYIVAEILPALHDIRLQDHTSDQE